MAGACLATFRSRGPQPPAAEARPLAKLVSGPRRLRPITKNRRVDCLRSGQPEPTQQPSAIELVRIAEAPGGSRNGNPPPADRRCRREPSGVGFAFLLAVRQCLSRLALLSPAALHEWPRHKEEASSVPRPKGRLRTLARQREEAARQNEQSEVNACNSQSSFRPRWLRPRDKSTH